MNIATLLINSSLFFIAFILLGLLARSIYIRKVVTPHRREVEAWEAHCQALIALSNDLLRQRDDVIRRFRRTHDALERTASDLRRENDRLKNNINYLGARYEETWKKLMVSRALLHGITVVLNHRGEVGVRKKLK